MRILLLVSALLLAPLAAAQDSSDFVKQAQERLKVLGFYDGPINGDFGPYMRQHFGKQPVTTRNWKTVVKLAAL